MPPIIKIAGYLLIVPAYFISLALFIIFMVVGLPLKFLSLFLPEKLFLKVGDWMDGVERKIGLI